MSYLILDADFLAYTVACVYQETYIMASHPKIDKPIKLKNKTELWGNWRKKDGGFVAEYNALNFVDYKPDEYSFTEHQEALSLADAKKNIATRIQTLLRDTGAEYYRGYVGRGDVNRMKLATLLEYKGNRTGPKPIHLAALKQYLVDDHNCKWVDDGKESDDAVAIDGYASYLKWKKTKKSVDKGIMCFEDKDLLQIDGWQYQVGVSTKPELRVGFGDLYRDDKGNVRGWGRKHLYWQSVHTEDSDNFSATCFSCVKWGDVAAYNLLKDCKNDKEAWEALVKGYQLLYPTPTEVTGWRGDKFDIDAIYVLNENFNLAKMLRSEDEKPTVVKDVLDKLKVNY